MERSLYLCSRVNINDALETVLTDTSMSISNCHRDCSGQLVTWAQRSPKNTATTSRGAKPRRRKTIRGTPTNGKRKMH